jgi:hypothetical protein
MMNEQRIFDVTVAFLAGQRRKASVENGVCKYRGPDNTRCAAGLWIEDRLYNPKMEGPALSLECENTELAWGAIPIPDEYKPFMIELQNIHDRTQLFDTGGWNQLVALASIHRLDMTVLQAVWTGVRAGAVPPPG